VILVLVIVGVLVLGLAAAALVLRSGVPGVPDPVTTESFEPLPRGVVEPQQVTELQFDQAIRGYRMSQVDDVLDQLTEELRDRDAEVARLRAELAAVPADFTGRGGVVEEASVPYEREVPYDPEVRHEDHAAPDAEPAPGADGAGESDRGDL